MHLLPLALLTKSVSVRPMLQNICGAQCRACSSLHPEQSLLAIIFIHLTSPLCQLTTLPKVTCQNTFNIQDVTYLHPLLCRTKRTCSRIIRLNLGSDHVSSRREAILSKSIVAHVFYCPSSYKIGNTFTTILRIIILL
jgi:hypothetical protein